MDNIRISFLDIENLEELHELFMDSYITSFLSFDIDRKLKSTRDFLYESFRNPHKRVLTVLDEKDKLLGIAILKMMQEGTEIEIVLSREAQKRGIGTFLITHLKGVRRSAGDKYMYANIHKDNLLAKQFAKKLGFKEYLSFADRKIYII